MATMGRRRKSNPLGLASRVYAKHGAFYYVHKDGRWERLGTDVVESNRKAALYNDEQGRYGTMAYWLELFLADCEVRVKAQTLAPRTLADYRTAILGSKERDGALRVFFAPPMTPLDVTPGHVQDFLVTNRDLGRPVPANRERACLSACFGWLLRTSRVPGLQVNPCLRASGIKRNEESVRDRYVTHEEYRAVWAVAHPSVRIMMGLTYRTLQRPESDIIGWTTKVLLTEDGVGKLHFRQNKTGKLMKIELSAELDALIRGAIGDVPNLLQPLVHTREGKPYSYTGLMAMLRRCFAKVNAGRVSRGLLPIESFGFRDLKGKGATDMWLGGVPLEEIQMLCGHDDKGTTERYVKQRWRETAQPNRIEMAV